MKYFGTDGIRGKVGGAAINPSFFVRLGWAIGRSLKPLSGNRMHKVAIGKDTRISGYMLETALQAGLSAAGGVDVYLLGPIPTPGVAYLTHSLGADLGAMISASHNVYYDNGIKLFGSDGCKISEDTINKIEVLLDQETHDVASSSRLGKLTRINEATGRYLEYCRQIIAGGLDLSSKKIVLDCAHGATYKVAPTLFKEMGAEIISIGVKPNGININDNCGSTNASNLRDQVLRHKADIGIAFDGDGDRVLLVDKLGRLLEGDRLLYIIATDMLKRNNDCVGVVGTLMSNMGLEQALQNHQILFSRSSVGDTHVWRKMQEKGWKLGGEPSGHILYQKTLSTGDGVIAALLLLDAWINSGRDLGEWGYEVDFFHQAHRSVRLSTEHVTTQAILDDSSDLQKLINDIENQLKPGRVVCRPSGTEPLVRLMVEGSQDQHDLVESWANNLEQCVVNAI